MYVYRGMWCCVEVKAVDWNEIQSGRRGPSDQSQCQWKSTARGAMTNSSVPNLEKCKKLILG